MRAFKLDHSLRRHSTATQPPAHHRIPPDAYLHQLSTALPRLRDLSVQAELRPPLHSDPVPPSAAPSPPRQTCTRALRVHLLPVAARGHRCAWVCGAVFCFVVWSARYSGARGALQFVPQLLRFRPPATAGMPPPSRAPAARRGVAFEHANEAGAAKMSRQQASEAVARAARDAAREKRRAASDHASATAALLATLGQRGQGMPLTSMQILVDLVV